MPETYTSRAVVVTTNRVDAELALQHLNEDGIGATTCDTIQTLCAAMGDDIGCVVLTSESLTEDELPLLRELIENQPAWSDLPLILIAPDSSRLRALVERAFTNSGNLTLLEQPLNPATLVSAVRVGLRSRARQMQMRDLLTQREEALRLRNEFLAMLAHELRNPLSPMRNAVYLQQQMPIDDPLFVKTREIFDRQVTHLSRMVDDLLDVARLERGKVQLKREPVDANVLATAAVEACQTLIRTREHAVKLDLAREPLVIDADPVRLEQLVTNLVANAAKFTPPAGEITVSTRRDGAAAVVTVRDNGIGLRPEMVNAIFNPFTQDDRTLARSAGGLGIGLTIARRIAELHGGALDAHSEGLNKGSTFVIRLPLASAAAKQPSSVQEWPMPAVRPRRVLIVEDNADIRESLGIILAQWGHDVTIAETGQKGLESIGRDRPDIALIDIGLPGMTGYDMARTVRAQTRRGTASIRLVAITGYGQPADRKRAFDAGFDMHLLKPIDPEALRRILSSA